jgi:hypothetical protein
MKTLAALAAVTLGVALSLSTARALADEEDVPVDKLPKAVVKAIKAKFPEAKIEEAVKEEEDGKTLYELTIEDDDEDLSVTVTAKGKILEVEREIDPDDLPEFVEDAIEAKYGDVEIEKVEEVQAGRKFFYEVVIEKESGKQLEVVIQVSLKFAKETELTKEKESNKAEKGEREKGKKKDKDRDKDKDEDEGQN